MCLFSWCATIQVVSQAQSGPTTDLLDLSHLPSLWHVSPFQCFEDYIVQIERQSAVTQSDSGGLKSSQLHRALAVPCMNRGGGEPHGGCRTARSHCENKQASSVPPRGSPAGAGLQGLPKQGGGRLPPRVPHFKGKRVLWAFHQHAQSIQLLYRPLTMPQGWF